MPGAGAQVRVTTTGPPRPACARPTLPPGTRVVVTPPIGSRRGAGCASQPAGLLAPDAVAVAVERVAPAGVAAVDRRGTGGADGGAAGLARRVRRGGDGGGGGPARRERRRGVAGGQRLVRAAVEHAGDRVVLGAGQPQPVGRLHRHLPG